MDSSTRGRLGGVLFGGIFAAVGIGFLIFSIIPTLYESWQMQGWQPVQAEVLEAKLDSHRSDNSTTYSVSARYRYQWQGRDYVGSRVGISSGSDNIGNWHHQHYSQLRSARSRHTPVTVWVDPAAPQNAIIDREVRWGLFAFKMIFVVVFGGAGIGIMWFMARKARTTGESSTPWLEKSEWRSNRIRSGGKAVVVFLWIFGIVWSLFMIPLWMNADELSREGMPLSLFPYLFPLIGLAVLVQALIKTLRWRRFGEATLSLQPFPGVPGGKVGGRVELPLDYRQQIPVAVRLSCIHVYWRRSGKSNERREDILWQDSRQVKLQPAARGGVLEFSFSPPANLPSSSEGSDHHKWVVELSAKLAGPDLAHRFTIPVYANQALQSQPEPEQDYVLGEIAPAVKSSQAFQSAPSSQSLPPWLRIGYQHGGIEWMLPMFRNLTLSLVLGVMGLVFGGAGMFMLQQEDVPFFFALIFALVGGGMLLGGLYSLGNSLRVHASSRGLAIVRRVFGFPFSRTVPAAEITGMEKQIGAQSGSQAYYRVYARTRQGKRITLADSLPSASAADYLIGQLGTQLHLRPGEEGGMSGELPPMALEMAKKVQGAQKWIRLIGFVIFALIFGETIWRFFNF